MAINRRDFIGCTGGAFASACTSAKAVDDVRSRGFGRELMRFGALSDIHIIGEASCRPFEKALRAFDEWKADGVVACGDLTDWGLVPQLKHVADTWFKVFPKGRRSDGRPIANLLHYGDHDTSGYTYRHCKPCVEAYPDEEEVKKIVLGLIDRKAAWENCFQEEWAPIVKKTVKGFDFILSHFTKGEPTNKAGNNVPGLVEFLEKADLDPNRPFFYSQHRVPKNTVGGPFFWGQDDGTSTSYVFSSKYPNCIALCGHNHLSCTEERAIWQGGFTCVQVPSLSYTTTLAGRENGMALNDRPFIDPIPSMPSIRMSGSSKHALFITVYERAIVISRRELVNKASLGPDWVIPLPAPGSCPYSFANRARNEVAPEFPSDAKIKVSCVKGKDRVGKEQELYCVEFPVASSTSTTPRANDYSVSVEVAGDDVIRVYREKRVFSQRYTWDEKTDSGFPVQCCFDRSEVPTGVSCRFAVRPCGSFGARGKEIYTPFQKYTWCLPKPKSVKG